MHYLIDGHNLIGKLPDIQLDDPDDEMALVLRLRQWAAVGRKRRLTVIFDRGLPGGQDKSLSTGNVKVVFASGGQSADTLLLARIQRAKNPGEYTLVSSDNRIRQAALARRMPLWLAEEFAGRMAAEAAGRGETVVSPTVEPSLSAEEVDEWLALFGNDEAQPRRPGKRDGRGGQKD